MLEAQQFYAVKPRKTLRSMDVNFLQLLRDYN
jgi:hypothetical protein